MTPYRPVDALFAGRRDAIDARICYRCREPVDFHGFTDPIARAEYEMSGIGECCQAAVFVSLGDECE